jgi:hypothetical protein
MKKVKTYKKNKNELKLFDNNIIIIIIKMNTSTELSIKLNWSGARERMVTHIKNLSELAKQLGLTKFEIRNYLLTRILSPLIYIEGDTLKITGFVTEPMLKILFDEYYNHFKPA